MAIDSIALVLSLPSAPIYKENTQSLTATATTKLSGSDTDATQVEFELLYATFGGIGLVQNPGLGEVIARNTVSVSTSTGIYNTTFTPAQFSQPGWYMVQAKGIVGTGSPLVINTFLVAQSDVFQVADKNQADKNNVFTDEDQAEVETPNFPLWSKTTLTGADILAATGVNTGTTKTVQIASLPAGALVTGTYMNVTTADTSSVSTITGTFGTNSSAYNDMISATSFAATGAAESGFPAVALSTALKTVITITGSGKYISDISTDSSIDFYWSYVLPQTHTLGV